MYDDKMNDVCMVDGQEDARHHGSIFQIPNCPSAHRMKKVSVDD